MVQILDSFNICAIKTRVDSFTPTSRDLYVCNIFEYVTMMNSDEDNDYESDH